MNRKSFLKALGAAAGAAALAPAVHAQRTRRNLVFILSDDHRFDAMSHYGHPFIRTPHMDRMIANGMLFENAFVTTSLCSPSRATILSGQYVHCHQVTDNSSPLPAGTQTFPELLQKAGYKTGFFGKWHMGGASDDPRPGFDEWLSFRGQGTYVDPVLNRNGVRNQARGYVTDILTEEANKFLGENRDRPFFLYLSHKAVHGDFYPARRHENLFEEAEIPYPPTFADTEENYRGKPRWVKRQRNSWHGVDGMYNNRTNFEQFSRDYARTLAALDDSIGSVMNRLEELGLAEDTLVIYMGDNGFLFGEHGLIDKRCMYEPSIRVPMIGHCPSLFGKGKKTPGMALNLDIAETFLDAGGVAIPPEMHGRSLLDLVRGAEDWRKEFVYEYFWEAAYPQTPTVIGLRTDQHSYMHYQGVWDIDELYDVQRDPHQRNNLLAEFETTTQGGPLINRVRERDQETFRMLQDFRGRIDRVMRETKGRVNPTWRG